MKTLNEVIKAFEQSNDKCYGCAYHLGDSCIIKRNSDALHYLKEFQGLSKMWNDKLDKEEENNPLTWDELRQMKGEPVWVEESELNQYWAIIADVTNTSFGMLLNLSTKVGWKGLHVGDPTWKAYRKER